MKNEKVISIIGITWLLLWTSYIPQLVSHYPFQEHKGVKSLIEEVSKAPDFIKKESGLLNRTPADLEDSVMREIRREWIKGVLIVFAGLLSAVLLLKKKRIGRLLVLSIAICLLLLKIFYFVKYWQYKMSPQYWEINFRNFPVQTVQSIAAALIMIVTVILLLRLYRKDPNEPVHSVAPKGRRVSRMF
jgi:hypothetical protein